MKITNRAFKTDLKRLQSKVDKTVKATTQQVMDKRVQLSFDDTEVVPYSAGNTGTILVAGTEESVGALEEALRRETESLTTDALDILNKEIRGLLK